MLYDIFLQYIIVHEKVICSGIKSFLVQIITISAIKIA